MKLSEYVLRVEKALWLARRCGISVASLSMYLAGKRGLSARTMAKIVKATGGLVTYEDLVAEMQEHKENIARLRCPGSEP